MEPRVRGIVVRPEQLVPEGWDDDRGRLSWVTLLSADRTPTEALTLGLATVPVGGFLAPHRHDPPEFYLLLAGRGLLTLDDDEREVSAGAAIFVPGNARHGIRTLGDEPLRFAYGFAVDSFDQVEYRF